MGQLQDNFGGCDVDFYTLRVRDFFISSGADISQKFLSISRFRKPCLRCSKLDAKRVSERTYIPHVPMGKARPTSPHKTFKVTSGRICINTCSPRSGGRLNLYFLGREAIVRGTAKNVASIKELYRSDAGVLSLQSWSINTLRSQHSRLSSQQILLRHSCKPRFVFAAAE